MLRIAVVLASIPTIALAAPCPPKDLFSNASEIASGKLAYCTDKDECWALDPATKRWATQPKAPIAASVTVEPTGVKACAAGGADCVTIATKAYPDGGGGIANADRSLVAVWAGTKLDLWDATTKKLRTTLHGWKSPMSDQGPGFIGHAQFLGGALAVFEGWSPVSSVARLYDARSGKLLGEVVGKGTEVTESAVDVGGGRWAFAGFAPKLYVVDGKTGKATQTFTIGTEAGGPVLLGPLADGRVVVANGGVVLVDPRTGKVTKVDEPTCTP